MTLIDL